MCIGLRGKSQEGFMYIIAYKILSRILLLLLLLRKSWSKDILSSASSFPSFMSARPSCVGLFTACCMLVEYEYTDVNQHTY